MAITILDVQSAQHNAATNTLALPAFAVDPSNGDTIIVCYANWSITSNQRAPTDSTGANTYTVIGAESVHGVPEIAGLWYAHNVTGGSSFVVTGHLNSNTFHTVVAWLISGNYVYNSDVATGGGTISGPTYTGGTTSPAPSGEAIWIGMMTYDVNTVPTDAAGWNDTAAHGFSTTLRGRAKLSGTGSNLNNYSAYIVASSAAQNPVWTGASGTHDYNAIVASFSAFVPAAGSFSALSLAP